MCLFYLKISSHHTFSPVDGLVLSADDNDDYDDDNDNNNNNNNNNNNTACMWNVKTRVIPVIIGANGNISKSFRKYVRSIPGNHEVRELQKTALLDTAHILRKVLM
jgi:hypothetical protein